MYLKDLRDNTTQELGEPLKMNTDTSLFDGHRYYEITLGAGYNLVVTEEEWMHMLKLHDLEAMKEDAGIDAAALDP